MKRLRCGFTLIELMVVVSIIIILASLAVPSFVKYREASYTAKCVANLRCIQDARESYFLTHEGVTEINGAEQDFLSYFGEVTSTASTIVLVDSDMIVCPYNDATYALSVNLANIDTMPTCPNAGNAATANPCAGHVYSGH